MSSVEVEDVDTPSPFYCFENGLVCGEMAKSDGVTWLSMRYADCMASESGWEKVGEDEEISACRVRRRERAREKR